MQDIFNKKLDTQAVCEPFCTGREFTVVILENRFGAPVALIPSEIETDYSKIRFLILGRNICRPARLDIIALRDFPRP